MQTMDLTDTIPNSPTSKTPYCAVTLMDHAIDTIWHPISWHLSGWSEQDAAMQSASSFVAGL